MLENQVKIVFIGIGSNLGKREENIEKAKYLLESKGVKVIQSSSYYETLSWPDASKPKFINIVIKSKTNLKPKKLMTISKEIERFLGRKKDEKNAPRQCDIDIIDYDKKIMNKDLITPHERMHKRNFVLFPLFELDKNWFHPKLKISIKNLIFSLSIKDIRSIKQI